MSELEKTDQSVDINIQADLKDIQTMFCDLIQVENTADSVIFNFLSKLPGDTEKQNYKLIARIAVSWPHFGRASRLFNQLVLDHREIAKESLENNLFIEYNQKD